MKYYIIRFTDDNKYYWSKNLLVSDICSAKKYSSKDYARRVAKNSRYADKKFEILEFSDGNDI